MLLVFFSGPIGWSNSLKLLIVLWFSYFKISENYVTIVTKLDKFNIKKFLEQRINNGIPERERKKKSYEKHYETRVTEEKSYNSTR